jgi:hypothetical protein
MPPAGFEPALAASERLQLRAATGIGFRLGLPALKQTILFYLVQMVDLA